MKTILHVTQCLGGVETYLNGLLEEGAFGSFRRMVLVAPAECKLTRNWAEKGGYVYLVPMTRPISPIRDFASTLELCRILKNERPAVLHLHSSKAGAIGRLAATACRFLLRSSATVVYTPHAYYYLAKLGAARKFFIWVERFLGPATHHTLATSPSEAKRAITDVALNPRSVRWVMNGIRASGPCRVHQVCKDLNVIFAGRVCYQKNVDLLTDIISRFTCADRVRFTVVGVGHYPNDREALTRALAEKGADPNVFEICGWVSPEEMLGLYAMHDVCIVTSRYESFGYVAAEASAAAVPCVASNVDGLCDVVVNNVTGLLIDSGDPDDWKDALISLRDDPDLRRRLGTAARQRASSELALRASARAIKKFYEEICA